MRKPWTKIFLLCMICMFCVQGLCLSKDRNWVKYHHHDVSKYYVDTTSIKTYAYEGRKYLATNVEIGGSPLRIALDVENKKYVVLEGQNHVTGKMIHNDMSHMISFFGVSIYEKLLSWVEQNRPDVIQEIRVHNQQYAAQHPQANVPTGTVAGGAANGDYGFVQTLGDGPVQYSARMIHTPPTQPVVDDGIWRSYVSGIPASGLRCRYDELIPTVAPDTANPLYIIYRSNLFNKAKHLTQNWIYAIFSYDDETNTFTLYDIELKASNRIHIVDQNNIEVDFFAETYSVDGEQAHFTYEYKKTDWLPDMDGNGWERTDDFPLGSGKVLIECPTNYAPDGSEIYNEVGLDGLFAFLACKGKVGYAPPASSTVEYVDQRQPGIGLF